MDGYCSVTGEDLVAYLDGYLAGGRRELVEAHLRTRCPACHERVAAFREVDRLVQAAVGPPIDDPAGRVALRERLEVEARRRKRRPGGLVLVGAVAALVLAVALFRPGASVADAPWGDWLRFEDVRVDRTTPPAAAPPLPAGAGTDRASVQAPAFKTAEPARLPLGLVLAERSLPNPRLLELVYRDPTGLEVSLFEAPTGAASVSIGSLGEPSRIVVGGTEVLVLEDPRPRAVAALFWERGGVVFDMLILASPPEGLQLADARAIIEAFMAAQDAPA
jgi:hypothetical protein